MAKPQKPVDGTEDGASTFVPSSPAEFFAEYLKGNPEYIHETAFVSEDGNIFPGTLKGQNSADNYKAASGFGYVEVSKS
jgi:hypothetical protein